MGKKAELSTVKVATVQTLFRTKQFNIRQISEQTKVSIGSVTKIKKRMETGKIAYRHKAEVNLSEKHHHKMMDSCSEL